jgi:predicted dehydrogenase
MNGQKLNLIPGDICEIKIAIAGMGKMGSYHLNALQQLTAGAYEDYYKGNINEQLRKIRICGICDIMPSRLISFGTIRTFDNAENMLEQTNPDILIVTTPTNTHKDIALAGLNRSIHTFVEKPIVTSVAQLNELLSVAQDSGCRLLAGHIERYNPVSVKIVSLLKNTKPLIESYSFIRTQKRDIRVTDDIITDKVIHDLDLALCFFGTIKRIKIDDFKLVDGQAYEVKLSLEHQDGIKGSIFVSWLSGLQIKKRQVEIMQGGHKWKGDFVLKQLWVDGAEIKCQVEGMIKPSNNQIKDELVDFIASCIDSAPLQKIVPLLSIDEIIESTKWLEDISEAPRLYSRGFLRRRVNRFR